MFICVCTNACALRKIFEIGLEDALLLSLCYHVGQQGRLHAIAVPTSAGAWREKFHIIYDGHEADAAIRRVAVAASRSQLSPDTDIETVIIGLNVYVPYAKRRGALSEKYCGFTSL